MLTLEIEFRQLFKHGEEICGDRVEIAGNDGNRIVVMSDGLGSGVKANILSSLTTKIISTMLLEGCSIHDVAETLQLTLPVCKVRGVAYSTFTALRIDDQGSVEAAEYDNPKLIWISNRKLRGLPRKEVEHGGRMKVLESSFKLKEDDWLVIISDGVVHAGIGRTWDLGWTWDRVAAYIKNFLTPATTSAELTEEVVKLCAKLYVDQPGDDTTIVAMHYRKKNTLTFMIGPPRNADLDETVVRRFLESTGKKIACGGTTGNLLARQLGKEIQVNLDSGANGIPPIGILEGVDLLTEGVLTLAGVVELLRKNASFSDLKYRSDGASRIVREIRMADDVHILLGQAINPAHQSLNTPVHLGLKFHLVEELQYLLEASGKHVTVEKF